MPHNEQNQQPIPSDRCITLTEVMARTGVSKTKVYAMINAGEFPRPAKFGRSSRWSERAVDRVIAQRFSQA